MRHNGIDPQLDPGKEMYRRQRRLDDQWERLEQDHTRLHGEIVSLQERLRRDVLRRWPRAAVSYTLGFKRFLEEDLDSAQAFIENNLDFPGLSDRQRAYWEQEDQALHIRREQRSIKGKGKKSGPTSLDGPKTQKPRRRRGFFTRWRAPGGQVYWGTTLAALGPFGPCSTS
jgi:hypothetical protein